MTALELARVGGPVAGLGLAALVLAQRRWQRLAALPVTLAGGGLLAPELVPRDRPEVLAAGVVAGLVVAAALAWAFLRWPVLFPAAALAAVPVRLTVEGSHLLLPLYVVLAAAALLLAWQLVRGDARAGELGALGWPLAGLVAWMGASLAWSGDVHAGALQLVAYVLPFALLALALARCPWTETLAAVLAVELVALAFACTLVGVYQYAIHRTDWRPAALGGAAHPPFFRARSVFWEPAVYGRFLVLAILVCLVVMLFAGSRRAKHAAALPVVSIWIGLLVSFSQASFFALVAGILVAVALLWRWRALGAVALLLVVVVAVGVAVPSLRHTLADRWRDEGGDRAALIGDGARIWTVHPLYGVGVGAFERAYAERHPHAQLPGDTPATVAAELGTPGLLLLAWLLLAALFAGLEAPRTTLEGRTRVAGALLVAALLAHSLFRDSFFEDPLLWGALGLVALASAASEKLRA